MAGNPLTNPIAILPNKDYFLSMAKKATVMSGHTRTVTKGNGPATGVFVEKLARSAATGQFLKVANTLKPMSKQGSISMAQARKAVLDYVRTK